MSAAAAAAMMQFSPLLYTYQLAMAQASALGKRCTYAPHYYLLYRNVGVEKINRLFQTFVLLFCRVFRVGPIVIVKRIFLSGLEIREIDFKFLFLIIYFTRLSQHVW